MATPMTRKQKTLRKLGWVCSKIEELLADQNITLADVLFPHEKKPGETDLERLQRFKAHLGETLTKINRGEDFVCRGCQEKLADAILDEMPWALTCPACPAA